MLECDIVVTELRAYDFVIKRDVTCAEPCISLLSEQHAHLFVSLFIHDIEFFEESRVMVCRISYILNLSDCLVTITLKINSFSRNTA